MDLPTCIRSHRLTPPPGACVEISLHGVSISPTRPLTGPVRVNPAVLVPNNCLSMWAGPWRGRAGRGPDPPLTAVPWLSRQRRLDWHDSQLHPVTPRACRPDLGRLLTPPSAPTHCPAPSVLPFKWIFGASPSTVLSLSRSELSSISPLPLLYLRLHVHLIQSRDVPWQVHGPWPLKSTGRHGHFLNSTCDIGLSDMRHRLQIIVTCDKAFS